MLKKINLQSGESFFEIFQPYKLYFAKNNKIIK